MLMNGKLTKWVLACVGCLSFLYGAEWMNEEEQWFLQAASPAIATSDTFVPHLPQNMPRKIWEQFIPENNPLTPAKVTLGKILFFDTRLSRDETVSCATCHKPELAFTDGKALSVGIQGRTGTRNAPTILNSMFHSSLFWDGRAENLEDQAKLPLINPVEMGMESQEAVVEKVKHIQEYPPLFDKAFGEEPTIDRLAQAIASFERTQLSGDAPFDRFVNGDASAISDSAQRGWAVFRGKGNCQSCHTFVLQDSPFSSHFQFFSFFKFQNIGIGARSIQDFDRVAQKIRTTFLESGSITQSQLDSLVLKNQDISELGRFTVTMDLQDLGAFKTTPLRDVELTAPYMHDGSLKTLMEVVEFYDKGGHPNAYLDNRIQPLGLTEQEKQDLVAFMKSLTGARSRTLTKGTLVPGLPDG